MKIQFKRWVIFIAAGIVLIGFAYAQTAKSGTAKTAKLESGEEVVDLSGEWDSIVEFYGRMASKGTAKNVIQISQEGSSFTAIRLQDDPGAVGGRKKGTMFIQGELDKSGIKEVYYIDGSARFLPCTGKLSEDGVKIKFEDGFYLRATLTRR
jgi:hypothetical protein